MSRARLDDPLSTRAIIRRPRTLTVPLGIRAIEPQMTQRASVSTWRCSLCVAGVRRDGWPTAHEVALNDGWRPND
jgi:hypothetical protein